MVPAFILKPAQFRERVIVPARFQGGSVGVVGFSQKEFNSRSSAAALAILSLLSPISSSFIVTILYPQLHLTLLLHPSPSPPRPPAPGLHHCLDCLGHCSFTRNSFVVPINICCIFTTHPVARSFLSLLAAQHRILPASVCHPLWQVGEVKSRASSSGIRAAFTLVTSRPRACVFNRHVPPSSPCSSTHTFEVLFFEHPSRRSSTVLFTKLHR